MTGLIVAHPDQAELMGQAYSTLMGLAGYTIKAMCSTVEELQEVTAEKGDVLIIDATLAVSANEAADLIAALGAVRVMLILPLGWEGHRAKFDRLDVVTTYTSPVNWREVAAELKRSVLPAHGRARDDVQSEERPVTQSRPEPVRVPDPAPRLSTPLHPASAGRGGVSKWCACAVWAGHAGGTGRTTMALSLGILAAEREVDVSLMALSEPALSTYLRLNRMPNVMDFAAGQRRRQDLLRVERPVVWGDGADPATLRVLLGPTRPIEGKLDRKQIGEIVEAVRSAHTLVILDLPPLVPGGDRWALEPLNHVTDVVLVMAPTVVGVSATVESLATLRDMDVTPAVHVVLNRRLPGGLPAREFCAGVEQVWGTCPPVVAEVPFLPEMPALMAKGELPNLVLGDTPLAKAVAACGEAAAGLPIPVVEEESREAPVQGRAPVKRQRRPAKQKRGFSKFFSVEVVD